MLPEKSRGIESFWKGLGDDEERSDIHSFHLSTRDTVSFDIYIRRMHLYTLSSLGLVKHIETRKIKPWSFELNVRKISQVIRKLNECKSNTVCQLMQFHLDVYLEARFSNYV